MQHNSGDPQSLEEMVARYGRALAVIDESTGELKVMGMGGAHSVDFDGKPKPGVKKPKGDGFDPEEDPDNEDEDEDDENYSEKELKVVEYLNAIDDEDFSSLYPEQNDSERAEELKFLFDTEFTFVKRALTNRRNGKKKRRTYKEISDDTEIKGEGPCWPGYKQVGMKKGKSGKMVPNCVPVDTKSDADECCPDGYFSPEQEIEIKAAEKKLRNPKGGLTAAGRAHFKRKEGANLKPGVKGAADTPEKMRRKGSFLTRFFTNPSGPMKDEKGRPTRLALSAAAWGESVPQNASDAAELAAKGRRMLERYGNAKKSKKKDAWDDVYVKQLGPTIGATGNTPDAEMVDRDGDGVVFDGTPDEKPTPKRKPYKKMSNSYLEKRRRRHVNRELNKQGVQSTKPRGDAERDARSSARETFNQREDRKRFVLNQLRKQGVTANAKKADRDDNERARRKAARAEYDRRVRDGEPKKAKPTPGPTPPKPKLPDGYVPGLPPDRYPEPKKDTSIQDAEDARNRRKAGAIARNETERFERLRPKDTSSQQAEDARNRAKRPQRPVDRLQPPPERNNRAEETRQERMRPRDRSSERVEDARNRAKRPQRPVDRYGRPGPAPRKKPGGYQPGDMV